MPIWLNDDYDLSRDYSGARIVRIFAPIGPDTYPNSSNGTDSPINNPEITLEGTKCDFQFLYTRVLLVSCGIFCVECVFWGIIIQWCCVILELMLPFK